MMPASCVQDGEIMNFRCVACTVRFGGRTCRLRGACWLIATARTVNHSNCGLGDALAVTLANATPLRPAFTTALLADNRLTGRGVTPLLQKLATGNLVKLVLSNNVIGLDVRGRRRSKPAFL